MEPIVNRSTKHGFRLFEWALVLFVLPDSRNPAL